MSDTDSREPLSNLSDSSFVILGPGSILSQVENECLVRSPDFGAERRSPGSHFDFGKSDGSESNCFSRSSYSEASIQEKLNELVKENYQLKETLSQNNLAIKSQLDTFFMWQQEVLKTHESHKQKFLETKDLILKLRAENISMKKQLDELSHGCSFTSAVDTPAHASADLNADGGKVGSELAHGNENLCSENEKLSRELESARKEILRVRKELEEAIIENLFLKQKNENIHKSLEESIPHKSLPNAEARAQISNLFKQLEEEKEKTQRLREALRKAESGSGEASGSKLSMMDELNHCINKLDDMNHSLDKQNQRFDGLNSWVSLAEENLKENQVSEGVDCNLMCEMREFKSHLNLEENAFREKQESVQDLKRQFTRLLGEYKALQQQLNTLSDANKVVEQCREEIEGLKLDLRAKEQQLTSKQTECESLKEELEKSKSKWSEEINVLQVQVELYEVDFNSERQAREKAVEEKERMAEQVRFLQSELKNLEQQTGVASSNRKSPLESPGKKPSYVCPRCMESFSNLAVCEEHVDNCLNLTFYP